MTMRWSCIALLTLLTPAVVAQPPATAVLKVANLRLPADAAQWRTQRHSILAMLEEVQADVIAVQQVQQSPEAPNPACWLAARLRYTCDFITADPPSQSLRRGNVLLSRDRVTDDGLTLLHGATPPNAAGMQRLQRGTNTVNIYVVRIRPQEDDAQARKHQTGDLRTWIAATGDGFPSLVVGDFSASTSELVQQLPGFQPARKNPTRHRQDAFPGAPSGHGMDVLYQVRRFTDIAQQWLWLPAPEDGPGQKRPLGLMVTVGLVGPDSAGTVETP